MKKHTFGAYLLSLRKSRNLSGQQLAQKLRVSQSRVSKIECGAIRPTRDYVQQLATVLNLNSFEIEELFAKAEIFWSEYAPWTEDEHTAQQRGNDAIQKIKSKASIVRSFDMAVVPSLLQTEAYMHSSILASRSSAYEDLDPGALLKKRLNNQNLLHRPNRSYNFLISEGALRARITTKDIHFDQIAKLQELSNNEHLKIGAVPWTAILETLPVTGFELYDDKLVSIATASQEIYLTDEHDIEKHRDVFRSLGEFACHGAAFLRLLDKIETDLRRL